jgi:hypothetical protein
MAEMSTIDRLLADFRGFRSHYGERRPQLFETQQQGQNPETMVISCSDSRVDPAILNPSEPGELFVCRNAANILPPFKPDGLHHGTSTALEFAVRDLGVTHVIIFGHSQCGGIQELVRGMDEQGRKRDFIKPWMSIVGGPCARRVGTGRDQGQCGSLGPPSVKTGFDPHFDGQSGDLSLYPGGGRTEGARPLRQAVRAGSWKAVGGPAGNRDRCETGPSRNETVGQGDGLGGTANCIAHRLKN